MISELPDWSTIALRYSGPKFGQSPHNACVWLKSSTCNLEHFKWFLMYDFCEFICSCIFFFLQKFCFVFGLARISLMHKIVHTKEIWAASDSVYDTSFYCLTSVMVRMTGSIF